MTPTCEHSLDLRARAVPASAAAVMFLHFVPVGGNDIALELLGVSRRRGRYEAHGTARRAVVVNFAFATGCPGPVTNRKVTGPADARAADWLDMAANRLRGAYEDTVRAVVVQQSAEELAKRAIEDTARHQEPLVAEAREIVRRTITDYGPLEAAFDEGVRAYRERHGSDEEGGGDGGDAEGEPRMDGQRTAS